MGNLKISDSVSLPREAITQTFGILAVRGAGKSNLARVMAEEMFAAKLPFVAIDPVGSWWGLRSARDGKKPGIEIPIFGGRHGDVPLERTGGALVADLVVDNRLSCVLDVSEFSEGDKTRFLIDFAERLYRRNQDPLHLFLEEADDYVPQRPFREQARLLRAWENIVRRGRARGLGMTMITQRSAALNKNVLTQIETLFVLRTTSPQDRKAIEAWVEHHGEAEDILESLPGLESGEAWVWSPSWLKKCDRIRARLSWTFDSGATPKDVRGGRAPATLADVDLRAIKTRMSETIERAKAEDPRELRREIAALKTELQKAKAPAPAMVEKIEVPVLKEWQVKDLLESATRLQENGQTLLEFGRNITAALTSFSKHQNDPKNTKSLKSKGIFDAPGNAGRRCGEAIESIGEIGTGGLRRILVALAQCPDGLNVRQIGVRAGLSSHSGTFGTYLARARAAGWVLGDRSLIKITDAGIRALGTYEPLPTGSDLLAYWCRELGAGEARLLQAVAEAYPKSLTKEEAAERAGLSAGSGTFGTYLSRLRTLELIEGRSELRASGSLFE